MSIGDGGTISNHDAEFELTINAKNDAKIGPQGIEPG